MLEEECLLVNAHPQCRKSGLKWAKHGLKSPRPMTHGPVRFVRGSCGAVHEILAVYWGSQRPHKEPSNLCDDHNFRLMASWNLTIKETEMAGQGLPEQLEEVEG